VGYGVLGRGGVGLLGVVLAVMGAICHLLWLPFEDKSAFITPNHTLPTTHPHQTHHPTPPPITRCKDATSIKAVQEVFEMHKAEGILGVVDTIGEFAYKPMVRQSFGAVSTMGLKGAERG